MSLETNPSLIQQVNSDGKALEIPDYDHKKDDSNDTESKYKVPKKYINSLKKKIKELNKEVENYQKNYHDSWDSWNAKWYEDMAKILQDLLHHLEAENNHDMKLAQIRVLSLTGDAVRHIPEDVYEFIIKGENSLKVYFQRILRKD